MADFRTTIEMKGTEAELLSLLKIIRMYTEEKHEQYRTKKDCAYLDGATVKSTRKKINDLSDDELLEVIKESDGQISIEASGPYGMFGFVDEVGLFEDMADAAPSAWFEGLMSGFNAGGEQAKKAELEDGLLKVLCQSPEDDMWCDDEEYDEEGGYDDEESEGDDNEWDTESLYIPIPQVDDPAMYVAQKINKGEVDIVFEKHNFAVSGCCSDKKTLIKEIETRGGKIRKSVGKTTHYVVIGNKIKGYEQMVEHAVLLNAENGGSIKLVTENELLALFK